jgi:hypothetical protein
MLPAMAGSLGVAVILFGGAGWGLYSLISSLVGSYGQRLFTQELISALQTTLLGFGPGMDSQAAARYGNQVGFVWLSESWFARSIYELGVPGLVLVVSIWLTILWRGWTKSRTIEDRQLRHVGVCFVAYLIVMLIASFKSTPLDQDPSNVYMWLIAGLLLRLPWLAPPESQASGANLARGPRGVHGVG